MPEIRCIECGGSGKTEGGGMVKKDCEHCEGTGKPLTKERYQECEYCGGLGKIKEIDFLEKNTESYEKSIEKIKQLDDKISNDEAERILDDEIAKQKTKRKK